MLVSDFVRDFHAFGHGNPLSCHGEEHFAGTEKIAEREETGELQAVLLEPTVAHLLQRVENVQTAPMLAPCWGLRLGQKPQETVRRDRATPALW